MPNVGARFHSNLLCSEVRNINIIVKYEYEKEGPRPGLMWQWNFCNMAQIAL